MSGVKSKQVDDYRFEKSVSSDTQPKGPLCQNRESCMMTEKTDNLKRYNKALMGIRFYLHWGEDKLEGL